MEPIDNYKEHDLHKDYTDKQCSTCFEETQKKRREIEKFKPDFLKYPQDVIVDKYPDV